MALGGIPACVIKSRNRCVCACATDAILVNGLLKMTFMRPGRRSTSEMPTLMSGARLQTCGGACFCESHWNCNIKAVATCKCRCGRPLRVASAIFWSVLHGYFRLSWESSTSCTFCVCLLLHRVCGRLDTFQAPRGRRELLDHSTQP